MKEADTIRESVRLHVDDFHLLRENGAFEAYHKAELLDGKLWGVFRAPEDVPQWDNIVPIMLRPTDHEFLDEAGAFEDYVDSELIDGEIWVTVATSGSKHESQA